MQPLLRPFSRRLLMPLRGPCPRWLRRNPSPRTPDRRSRAAAVTDYDYDAYEPEPLATLEQPRAEARPRRGCSTLIYNAVTLFFVVAAIGVALYVGLLLRNPQHPFNPFPPGRAAPDPGVVAFEAAPPEAPTPPPAEPTTPPPTTELPTVLPAPTASPASRMTATPAAPTPTGAPLAAAPSERLFELAGGEVERRQYTGPERC